MKKLISFILILCVALGMLAINVSATSQFTVTASGADGGEILISKANSYTASIRFTLTSKSGKHAVKLRSVKNTSTNEETALTDEFSGVTSYTTKAYDIRFSAVDAGKTVTLQLSWSYSGSTDIYTEDVDVALSAPTPKIKIETNIDELTPVPGATVKIKYSIINVGNVPLKYVTVTDEKIAELAGRSVIYQMNKSSDTLDVGKSVSEEVSLKVDETVVSAPKAVFAYDGEEFTQTFKEEKLEVNDVVPDVSFWCDNYTVNAKGDNQTFNYTVTNGNKVKLEKVCIYNSDSDDATAVGEPVDIEAGQTYTGSFTEAATHSGFFKFKISYTYEGCDGTKEIIAKTERAIKFPNEVYLRVSGINPSSISEPGDVTFTLTIENNTTSDLRNITISEDSGLMSTESLNVIIAGATQSKPSELTRDVTVKIPATGTKLKFILSYTLDDELYTTNASYEVNFDAPLEVPTPTPEATVAPTAANGGNSGLLIGIIICLIILVLVAVAIIILIVIKRKRTNAEPENVHRKMNDNFGDNNEAYDDDGNYDDYDDEYTVPQDGDDGVYIDGYGDGDDIEGVDGDEIDDDGVKIYRKNK